MTASTQAREMQANGDLTEALAKVEQVLVSYPNEVRLVQLRATLRNLGAISAPAVVPADSLIVCRPRSKPEAPVAMQTETVSAVQKLPAIIDSTSTIDRSMGGSSAAQQGVAVAANQEPAVPGGDGVSGGNRPRAGGTTGLGRA